MATGMNEPTIETLARLFDAFNAHDLDSVMSFFVDDCVLEMPRGPGPWGEARRERSCSRGSGGPIRRHRRRPLRRAPPVGQRKPRTLRMASHRYDHGGREDRALRLRPVRVPRRQDRPEGLLLEDRRGVASQAGDRFAWVLTPRGTRPTSRRRAARSVPRARRRLGSFRGRSDSPCLTG